MKHIFHCGHDLYADCKCKCYCGMTKKQSEDFMYALMKAEKESAEMGWP